MNPVSNVLQWHMQIWSVPTSKDRADTQSEMQGSNDGHRWLAQKIICVFTVTSSVPGGPNIYSAWGPAR